VDAHGIVIVEPELDRLGFGPGQFLLQDKLHRQAVLHRWAGHDTDLRNCRGQVVKPVEIGFRQAVPDEHQKGEILVALCGDRGKREGFEVPKPQLHAVGRIEIGLAVHHGIMHPFEPAESGIGKPADTQNSHVTRPRLTPFPSCWQMRAAGTRPKPVCAAACLDESGRQGAVDNPRDSPYTRPIQAKGVAPPPTS